MTKFEKKTKIRIYGDSLFNEEHKAEFLDNFNKIVNEFKSIPFTPEKTVIIKQTLSDHLPTLKALRSSTSPYSIDKFQVTQARLALQGILALVDMSELPD